MTRNPEPRGAQLALPFLPARSFAEADFVEGQGNAQARGWLARWPDWPSGRLALWGPTGSGKSHLAAIWRARAGAVVLDGAALSASTPDAVLAGLPAAPPHALVEGADGAEQGRALLHLINAVAEAGGTLLLTARQPPARWPVTLPDLRSRLAAMAAVAIAAPDEALVAAVLAKLLADRQVSVKPAILAWLALRLPRDFAAVQALAAALDAAALAAGGPVTRPIAAAALAQIGAKAAGDDDNSMHPGGLGSPPGAPVL